MSYDDFNIVPRSHVPYYVISVVKNQIWILLPSCVFTAQHLWDFDGEEEALKTKHIYWRFWSEFFHKPTPGSQTLKSDPTKFDVNSL